MSRNSVVLRGPSYPAVRFLLRYGRALAAIAGLAPIVGGVYFAMQACPIFFTVSGVVLGAFVYLLMRSYVELVTIVADMLIPK